MNLTRKIVLAWSQHVNTRTKSSIRYDNLYQSLISMISILPFLFWPSSLAGLIWRLLNCPSKVPYSVDTQTHYTRFNTLWWPNFAVSRVSIHWHRQRDWIVFHLSYVFDPLLDSHRPILQKCVLVIPLSTTKPWK